MELLLSWLRVTDVELAGSEAALELVREALDEVDEEDPAYAWLLALEGDLQEGRLPLQRLKRFQERFSPAPIALDEALELEAHYRRLAESLPEADWKTRRLERIFRWIEGQDEDLEAIRDSILQAWESYQSVKLTPAEITAETVAGHRLLLDGLECWLQALDLLQEDDPSQQQEALNLAIYANRLLVAVQQLHQQVERAGVSSPVATG